MTSDKTTTNAEFLNSEIVRLGCLSCVKTASVSSNDADDLLDTAILEDLTPDQMKAVVWAVQNYPVDWAYQLWNAQHAARMPQLEVILQQAGLQHVLTTKFPEPEKVSVLDALAE